MAWVATILLLVAALAGLGAGARNIVEGDRSSRAGDKNRALVLRCAGVILAVQGLALSAFTLLFWSA